MNHKSGVCVFLKKKAAAICSCRRVEAQTCSGSFWAQYSQKVLSPHWPSTACAGNPQVSGHPNPFSSDARRIFLTSPMSQSSFWKRIYVGRSLLSTGLSKTSTTLTRLQKVFATSLFHVVKCQMHLLGHSIEGNRRTRNAATLQQVPHPGAHFRLWGWVRFGGNAVNMCEYMWI